MTREIDPKLLARSKRSVLNIVRYCAFLGPSPSKEFLFLKRS